MAADIDEFYAQKRDYQIERDRKVAKKEKKTQALIEQQRLKRTEMKVEDKLNNDELIDIDEKPEVDRKVKFAADVESSDSDEEMGGGVFLNPLLVSKQNGKKGDEDSEEWSDDGSDGDAKKKNKDKKKDIKLGKRKKRDEEDHDFFTNNEIEVVPQETFEKESDMDSDDMAETRAIAKLMLRKKARTEIID